MSASKKIAAAISTVAVMCALSPHQAHSESLNLSSIRMMDATSSVSSPNPLEDQGASLTHLFEYYKRIPKDIIQISEGY